MMKVRGRKGFTFIEMVVVFVLVSLLSSVLIPVMMTTINATYFHQTRTLLVESARYALDRVILETFRNASDRSIRDAQPDSYEFDGLDECVDPPNPTHRVVRIYQFDNGTESDLELQKCYTGSLSQRLDLLEFSYFGGGGQLLAAPIVQNNVYTNIRTVRIKMRYSRQGMFPSSFTVETEVRPKNLRSYSELLP